MAGLLLFYIVAVLYRVAVLFSTGGVIGGLLALGLLIISLVALWALWREICFGIAGTRLTKILAAEGGLLDLEITADASGRPVRAQAKLALPQVEAAASADPQNWRAQQRLGIVRRAAGDAAGARRAINSAIKLEKQTR